MASSSTLTQLTHLIDAIDQARHAAVCLKFYANQYAQRACDDDTTSVYAALRVLNGDDDDVRQAVCSYVDDFRAALRLYGTSDHGSGSAATARALAHALECLAETQSAVRAHDVEYAFFADVLRSVDADRVPMRVLRSDDGTAFCELLVENMWPSDDADEPPEKRVRSSVAK